MPRTGSKRHTHKYHKVDGLWTCALPNCTHFMPLNVANHVAGKTSICWGCSKEIILDEFNMNNDMPQCAECSGLVTQEDANKLEKYLADRLRGI